MKKHAMPEVKEGGVNVTPLIDIVMCLIIFFMLVAKIGVSDGSDKKITPPETVLGVSIKDIGNTLILNVTKVPGGAKEPLVTAMLDRKQAIPKEVKILAENGDKPLLRALEASRKTNKNFKIILLCDKDVPYEQLEQVLITAATAQVHEINFKTRQSSVPLASAQ